jgi:hypothetical protein
MFAADAGRGPITAPYPTDSRRYQMDVASKRRRSPGHDKSAAVGSFATGLSAWLGGIAFCFGFGITAPAWVAGPLTVLSVGVSVLYMTVSRRGRRTASSTH